MVVKVVSHGEDCSFMLEQVGEVWTRLTHDNIVVCCAAETFPAAALAATRQDLVSGGAKALGSAKEGVGQWNRRDTLRIRQILERWRCRTYPPIISACFSQYGPSE